MGAYMIQKSSGSKQLFATVPRPSAKSLALTDSASYSRLNWTVTGLETTCTYVTFHVESNGEVRFSIQLTVQLIKSGNEVKIRMRSGKVPYFPPRSENSAIFLTVSYIGGAMKRGRGVEKIQPGGLRHL